MPGINDEILFNFLLTQKSVTRETPYDVIEQVIQSSIEYVKTEIINARIANLALNIDGKLVLAQVYVERQNGFAPTREQQFGTTPTSYNVQIRFPFGLETRLSEGTIVLPNSDFKRPLGAYHTGTKVSDDVQRDYQPAAIVLGPGVRRSGDGTEVILECIPEGQAVRFKVRNEIGKGYATISGNITEYSELEDYNQRLKAAGVYPLFYSSAASTRQGLLRHHNYRGYTNQQTDIFEPRYDGEAGVRAEAYRQYLLQMNQEILASDAGQYWQGLAGEHNESDYVFNITVVNGTTLFTDSGLPVIRLRDYQLDLFNNCQEFIEQAAAHNRGSSRPNLASKIDMGVGAGKTFFTFTLLQYLKHLMQTNPGNLTPSFCMAPDEAVAEVTKRAINRQGIVSGMSAAAISRREQMPGQEFMVLYQAISERAARDAEAVDDYLNQGLQAEILGFCRANSLHPNKLINLIYNQSYNAGGKLQTFKDSIDVKRLLLMVEGQKTIKNKTGMLGISALSNLLEQFDTLKAGITEGLTAARRVPLFSDAQQRLAGVFAPNINYNQSVHLPRSMTGVIPGDKINIAELSTEQLLALLTRKNTGNRQAVRDDLMRIACLKNNEAAVLLANSGGLGNTSSQQEIVEQIHRFLPDAAAQIHELTHKADLTGAEHYQLYVYFSSLFSTIPDEISLKPQIRAQKNSVEYFEQQLYIQSLQDNLRLVDHIRQSLQAKMAELGKVENLNESAQQSLEQFHIQPESSLIEATNQLAGFASMHLTGRCVADDANLLLSHIPVFTPEGIACYIEHLAGLERQPRVHFEEHHGIYCVRTQGRVTKENIQSRLRQFLSAIMIADEVHKEEFKFLYDSKHPVYQRINRVTQQYLRQEFKDILPHRIGMSGTMNVVAQKAFGSTTLYSLPTQKMIQQGLMKKVTVDTRALSVEQEEYAKQIVIDYFTQSANLSLINVLNQGTCAVDLFQVSKGLIFSKVDNAELNARLVYYFNLLTNDQPADEEQGLQAELFARINERREARAAFLQGKLDGVIELSAAEIEQINLYNRSTNRPIRFENGCISNAFHQPVRVQELNARTLQAIQRRALQNNNFALYLEYILSKSSSPKELSDIIGLQNNLFEKGIQLVDFANARDDREISNLIALINSIDTKSITQADVSKFIEERINDSEQRAQLIGGIMRHKNNFAAFANEQRQYSARVELGPIVTTQREQFEAGKTMLMLGGARERTGYSHEPVGIIMDVPANVANHGKIAEALAKLGSQSLGQQDIQGFLTDLQTLAYDSFSYNEKNQAGGRALRTPYGQVRYVEYQSGLNLYLAQQHDCPALQVLKLETEFQEIFTSNEALVQEQRESVTFNRKAVVLLEQDFATIADFKRAVESHFAQKLSEPATSQQYSQYMIQRLPLLWAMKYQTDLAQTYFAAPDEAIFNPLRQDLLRPDPVKPVRLRSPVSRKDFDDLLAVLQVKTNALIALGNIDSENYDPDYVLVGKQAALLNKELAAAADEYFAQVPTKDSIKSFRDRCSAAIREAKEEFGNHRGWGAVNPIVRGILGFFAFITVLPGLIVASTAKHGYCGTFFTNPPTDSLERLEDFESRLRL